MSWMSALRGIVVGFGAELLDLVLPRPCPGCGAAGQWCQRCATELGQRPRRVRLSTPAAEAAAAADLPLPPVRAITRYAGPVRAAILAGKEAGRRDLPPLLGRSAGTALLRVLSWSGGGFEPVWIVPAPSRRVAARRRGGDPVTAMAVAAAQMLAAAGLIAGVAPCLITGGRAADSVGLSPAARMANLAGRVLFRTSGAPPPGAAVVVLDDVITSGSTAVVAAAVLHGRGFRVQEFLALAAAGPWAD